MAENVSASILASTPDQAKTGLITKVILGPKFQKRGSNIFATSH